MTGCTLTRSPVEPDGISVNSFHNCAVFDRSWNIILAIYSLMMMGRVLSCNRYPPHPRAGGIPRLQFWLSSERFPHSLWILSISCVSSIWLQVCVFVTLSSVCASSQLPDSNHHRVGAGWPHYHRRPHLLLLLLLQVWKTRVGSAPKQALFLLQQKEEGKHNGCPPHPLPRRSRLIPPSPKACQDLQLIAQTRSVLCFVFINPSDFSETRGRMRGWKDKTTWGKLVRKKGRNPFY